MTDSSSGITSLPARRTAARLALDISAAVLAGTVLGLAVYAITGTLGIYDIVPDPWPERLNLVLPGVIVALAAGAAWRRAWLRLLAPTAAACAVYLGYLVWDDGSPPPASLPPAASPDSRASQIYCWMVKDDPRNRAAELRLPDSVFAQPPTEHMQWAAYAEEHRAVLAASWEEAGLAREWIEQLGSVQPEGVVPTVDASGPILAFTPVRRIVYLHWARAHLLANEGRYDEAATVLLGVLRATYHLQLAGTTLVNQMTPAVLVKGTYLRLGQLAATGKLSTETREQMRAVLRAAPRIEDNIARAIAGEEVVARAAAEKLRHATGQAPKASDPVLAGLLGRLLYNPNRTVREYAAFLAEVRGLAQRRQFNAQTNVGQPLYDRISAKRVKNPAGRQLAAMMAPAMNRIFQHFWETDDIRTALLKRLEA